VVALEPMKIGANNLVNARVYSIDSRDISDKVTKVEFENKEVQADKRTADINLEQLKSSVDSANKIFFKNNTYLKFEIHERTKEIMVRIVREDTGEVVKEIPPEKMLDMVAKIWETIGILVDEKR